MPVVEVNDIGNKACLGERFEQTPAKQEKTPLLVELIQTQVNPLIPTEEILIVKQVDGDRRDAVEPVLDVHSRSLPATTDGRAHPAHWRKA